MITSPELRTPCDFCRAEVECIGGLYPTARPDLCGPEVNLSRDRHLRNIPVQLQVAVSKGKVATPLRADQALMQSQRTHRYPLFDFRQGISHFSTDITLVLDDVNDDACVQIDQSQSPWASAIRASMSSVDRDRWWEVAPIHSTNADPVKGRFPSPNGSNCATGSPRLVMMTRSPDAA